MGREADHHARWKHNRKFLSTLDDEFCDWMLTAAFYAAVHAVETLFAHDKTGNHTSHETRNQTLRTVNRYEKIWRHYRPLYEASLTTRYDPSPGQWISAHEIKQNLIPSKLMPLERSVLKLIGKLDDALPPVGWIDG